MAADSAWPYSVRKITGQVGQGLCAARVAGGCGNSSKFTRLLQPWRSAVPMQSVPVSPPPITITSLSLAEM